MADDTVRLRMKLIGALDLGEGALTDHGKSDGDHGR